MLLFAKTGEKNIVMKVLLDIKDSKAASLMEVLKRLDYVKVKYKNLINCGKCKQ